MHKAHDLSEQMYLAFHDWRARLDDELDQLRTDYLRSLHTDMQRTQAHIEQELASRWQTDRAEQPEQTDAGTQMRMVGAPTEIERAYQAYLSEGGHA